MGGKKCYAILATPPSLAKTHEDNPKLHPLCSSPSAVSPLVIPTRFSSRHPHIERG